ncbi:hypothetical protein ETD83_26720 [Actinomadura soli]|uniref:Uncharacterized protein n=1 Tax=Actinomadura soli TaxID=2508997 RepID=A0A5C4J679_9ACTN|nr:hypothetical protein [Actinomadura soli]TMQ92737.1 hypothetical protein ETD83_26720 [Actinomadura soli]
MDDVDGGWDLIGIGQQWSAVQVCWAGIAGAMLVLSGCTNGDKAAALPTSSDSAAPTYPVSEDATVKRAYTAFVAMLDHADTLPLHSREQQLSALMVDPQLSRVLKRADELRSKNLTSYGQVIVHITSVIINGHEATLHDCQDSSNAGIMSRTTHKKINRGVKKGNTRAYMIKGTAGQWRVSKYVVLGEGC